MKNILSIIANEARGLAMDAIVQSNSGHLGLPLGCAELGAFLFGKGLKYTPHNPRWLNRDRFILSAGHGSLFLYTWFHLSGYDLSLDELKRFRQFESLTPGHPEFGVTPGVECTTGPLGQGIGNAVGMAIALKMAATMFNTEKHTIFDSHVVCLCGDGCLQEGVAAESISLAGHWNLDNLILLYDSNHVTLDAPLAVSQSEDVAKKFDALGWKIHRVDGHDIASIEKAFNEAKEATGGPQLLILETVIGKGIAAVEGTHKAHGASGKQFVKEAKEQLNLPPQSFYTSETTRQFFENHRKQCVKEYQKWEKTFLEWKKENPEKALLLTDKSSLENVWEGIHFDSSKPIATRTAAGEILKSIAPKAPMFVSGSADLHESTKNFIPNGGVFSKNSLNGKNFMFGVREHAMGAILNGIAYDGLFRPSGATFLVFSDYLKPSIRLAALAQLPVIYFFTHDSISVGEDGPTHQPIETLTGLRSIPNMCVVRPADAEETVGAFKFAWENVEGPTALILTRQDLPTLTILSAKQKREGVEKGAYVLSPETTKLEWLLMASGSEVGLALELKQKLGAGTRVVSMPCMECFNQQPEAYKETVLPSSCLKRIALEVASPMPWYRYVGLKGLVIGIEQFGISAPENEVRKFFGFTVEECLKKIHTTFKN